MKHDRKIEKSMKPEIVSFRRSIIVLNSSETNQEESVIRVDVTTNSGNIKRIIR
jgi:hypothetical protein